MESQPSSARALFPDLRYDRLRHPEAGLSQFSDHVIENNKSGLISFIKNGERARNLQPSANRLLPTGLLINEHYSACNSLARAIASLSPKSSCARMRLVFGLRTSTQLGALPAQSRTGFGATG
jgi:hypothetical protein